MINLTRFNGTMFWLNAELVETVEATPDVIITLTNGRKYIVKETAAQVVAAILAYRRRVAAEPGEEVNNGL